MKTFLGYRAGERTNRGLVRRENEDKCFLDDSARALGVIDGMGGHAGGKLAAEIAKKQMLERLRNRDGTPEKRLREAIAVANREILRRRAKRPEFGEMACVLTAAVIENGRVTIGHVGDSRAYVIRGGVLEQVTDDHSPVGRLVREGRLTEEEAMQHPNRNLVMRDVGSTEQTPNSPDFIDIVEFPFEPDSALLLCSDGLSDQVPPALILETVERLAADPGKAVNALISHANRAGGKDNVTVLIVAGPAFVGRGGSPGVDTERQPGAPSRRKWLIAGGAFAAAVAGALYVRPGPGVEPVAPPPSLLSVDPLAQPGDPAKFRTLREALAAATTGATVVVPPGEYGGPLNLKSGVTLRADPPGSATLLGAAADEAVVLADGLSEPCSVSGFKINADKAKYAVLARNAHLTVSRSELWGASEAALGAIDAELTARDNKISNGPAAKAISARASAMEVRGNHLENTLARHLGKAVDLTNPGARIVFEKNTLINFAPTSVQGLPDRDWARKNDMKSGAGKK